MQQQYNQYQLQPQATGFPPQQGFGQFNPSLMPQQTGFQPQQQFGQFQQQPYLNGNVQGSPFADPRPAFQPQPTGFGMQGPSQGGINSMLPPALQPQRTGFSPSPLQQAQTAGGFNQGFQPQPTGFQSQQTGFPQALQPQATGFGQPLLPQATGFGSAQQNGFGGFQVPPAPPIPQQPTIAPLQPQKTGPAPPIRFGVTEAAKKLAPQPTGRRANLANASKYSSGRSRACANIVYRRCKSFRLLDRCQKE